GGGGDRQAGGPGAEDGQADSRDPAQKTPGHQAPSHGAEEEGQGRGEPGSARLSLAVEAFRAAGGEKHLAAPAAFDPSAANPERAWPPALQGSVGVRQEKLQGHFATALQVDAPWACRGDGRRRSKNVQGQRAGGRRGWTGAEPLPQSDGGLHSNRDQQAQGRTQA